MNPKNYCSKCFSKKDFYVIRISFKRRKIILKGVMYVGSYVTQSEDRGEILIVLSAFIAFIYRHLWSSSEQDIWGAILLVTT